MHRAAVVVLLLLAPACFSPSGAGGTTTDDATTTTTTTTSTVTSTSTTTTGPEPTTTNPTTVGPTATATSDPTTSSTSSSVTLTSSDTDASCGDGMIEGDEECDDGNDIDTDACTHCRFAECGDGIVHAKVEECDGTPGCDPACRREFLWVFVTSDPVTSNFGGLDGADKICQNAAENAGRPGSYKAWLSIDLQSASQRFVHSKRAWHRTDNALVADDWDALTTGALENPITFDEFAEAVAPPGECNLCPVWTNSGVEGEPQGGDCGMWTGSMAIAVGGDCGAQDAKWTFGCGLNCGQDARLYCFEQPLEP